MRKTFFEKNQERIPILLEFSRNQKSLNQIFDDLEGANFLNMERVFNFAKKSSASNFKENIYDISKKFHLKTSEKNSNEVSDQIKQNCFLKMEFSNSYLLKICFEIILEVSNGVSDENLHVD